MFGNYTNFYYSEIQYRIILGNLCGSLKHRHNLLRDEQISAKELRLASRRVNSSEAENMSSSVFVASQSEELYPPGRIYHLVYSSVEKESSCLRYLFDYYCQHTFSILKAGDLDQHSTLSLSLFIIELVIFPGRRKR